MDLGAEWLEADGLGGFASGTVGGERTRRYHALLLAAARPPAGRLVLVNGMEAWVETAAGRYAISTQRYVPDVIYPDGARAITAFAVLPWPTWTYSLADGTQITQEILVDHDAAETVLRWTRSAGDGLGRLTVRPLISGRDYHALHHENLSIALDGSVQGGNVCWRPYPGLPAITALSNGDYRPQPDWFRNFLYIAERDRGLDCVEDLAAPGSFEFDLETPAVLILRTGDGLSVRAADHAETIAVSERKRRAAAASPLARAALSYSVDRGRGRTILAGFPWFTDWGRDTFIAMRGLVLATGWLAEAEAILATWCGLVSEGMLPNRCTDAGDGPEYNAVDASLWFVVAVHDFLAAAEAGGYAPRNEAALAASVDAILSGYARGTRYGIGLDTDGLIRAGVPGAQLTWMDAKVGDWVVTPRIGKPVEVQALWINALHIAQRWSPHWAAAEASARDAFAAKFPDPASGGLVDVVDVDHRAGEDDVRVRPNQILAVGGLPFPVLQGAAARAVVDVVEAKLLTPMGLRTLARDDPDYRPHYRGDPRARDGAYHQGTVWPWLIGPFADAWLRAHGNTQAAKTEARARFLAPLLAHVETAGLGHVSEIADGDPPHTPRGCPFQAWSLGEVIRLQRMLDDTPPG